VPSSLAALARGEAVYESFCRHCHGPTGAGDGPVAAAVAAFSMPVNGKSTLDLADGELFHIITFGRNNMPPHDGQLRQEDRWKVVHFLRDLQHAEQRRLEKAGIRFEEDPRRHTLVSAEYGRELFQQNCAACHGEEGREPRRGVPTLNHPRVLAVAGADYYRDIITHGRKGSQMPAWGSILTTSQIRSLTEFVKSWTPTTLDRSQVLAVSGDLGRGEALYRGNCGACHGSRGQGGIGTVLGADSFLSIASDSFLRDTIGQGRQHTAMPSGQHLTAGDVSDLISWVRAFSPPRHTWEQVQALLPEASTEIGRKLYLSRCAGCHGRKAEGGIGSRLDSQSFLSMVDDHFLYRAIAEGRPETAMPAWRHLEAVDVADLLAFVRSLQTVPPVQLLPGRHRGRAEFGEIIFQGACQSCHGPEGRGGLGGQIANPVFLDSASDEFLWRTIAYGKDGTAMRGFLRDAPGGALAPLSPAEIDHVIAWLRDLQVRPRIEPLKRTASRVALDIGRWVYEEKGACAKCHGLYGEGGVGPSLGNPAFLEVASDGFLMATIILGRENTEMLSYYRGGNVSLSQEEVEAVVGYLRSFETIELTRTRRVPATETSVAEGAALYRVMCAPCHGSEARGPHPSQQLVGYAPTLVSPEFLAAADDGFLLATIALGRAETPMRAFGKGAGGIAELSLNEIWRIVSYLRSFEPGPEDAEGEEP
jgi:cytochrome c oxidase cbb3-type subunit 3